MNNATGIISTIAGNGTAGVSGDGGPAASATLDAPSTVALDPQGNLYTGGYFTNSSNRVRVISSGSSVIRTFAGNGVSGYGGDGGPATLAELNQPVGIAADSQGNVFIADYVSARKEHMLPLAA